MLTSQLHDDLIQIEAETFEILDLTTTGQDMADGVAIVAGPVAACSIAATSSSTSCSSTCSSACSSTSSTGTSTSCSSCG